MSENEIGRIVVDAAIAIHRELGPGLLETVYEAVLARELSDRGLHVERQVPVSIQLRGIRFEEGFRADIIVEGKVILELKSVETVNNAHKKQLLTYLKLTGMKLGYLHNFGEALMKNGITRTVMPTARRPMKLICRQTCLSQRRKDRQPFLFSRQDAKFAKKFLLTLRSLRLCEREPLRETGFVEKRIYWQIRLFSRINNG